MVIAIYDSINSCDFAVECKDTDREKVEAFMKEGLDAWYCEGDSSSYEGSLFSKEEIASFYYAGYAEPTELLLKKNNIDYKVLDVVFDKNGYAIGVNSVIYY